MMYSDFGWIWLWMSLMMVVFLGAVAAIVVVAIVRRPDNRVARPDDARATLDMRFARGEIETDDYRHRRNILDGTAAE
jgi:putative membrane protein